VEESRPVATGPATDIDDGLAGEGKGGQEFLTEGPIQREHEIIWLIIIAF
jgi:hypothetical protein